MSDKAAELVVEHLEAAAEAARAPAGEVAATGAAESKGSDGQLAGGEGGEAMIGTMSEMDVLLQDGEEAKVEGNGFFGAQEWNKAATEYHRGIMFMQRLQKEFPTAPHDVIVKANALLLSCLLNLAQTQMHLGIPDSAYKACRMALNLDRGNAKAYFHLSRAEEALGDYEAARLSTYEACKLQPKNKKLRKRLKAMTAAVKKEHNLVKSAFKGMFRGDELASTEDAEAKAAKAAERRAARQERLRRRTKKGKKKGSAGVEEEGEGGEAAAAEGGERSDSSESDSDYTSSSGDEAVAEEGGDDAGEEEEYSDRAAYRKGVQMGVPPDVAGMMVARGEGPILMAGFKSVEEYERSRSRKAAFQAQREERHRRRRLKYAKKAAQAAAAERAAAAAVEEGAGSGAAAPPAEAEEAEVAAE